MLKRQQESCLQYIQILEAEHLGQITVHVHMPYKEMNPESWYKDPRETNSNRDNQEVSSMIEELEKAFFPPDGDTDGWNS